MEPNLNFDLHTRQLTGPSGSLALRPEDVAACRFLMLLEGQCLQGNIATVAAKYGYCRQRYYQLLDRFKDGGLQALQNRKTGPKTKYRRTDQAVRQVLRHLFLDPEASAAVVAQKLRQTHFPISLRSVRRIIADYGLQKKLYLLNPCRQDPPALLTAQSTRQFQRKVRVDEQSLERDVRQLLADKVSGNLLGLWLLVPEHLRLGTWDLLRHWTATLNPRALAPRLALHLVHEAALCRPSLRYERSLRHKGFELAQGLTFLPADTAIHNLLAAHTCQQASQLQVRLGLLRRASGHFLGQVLALDPHRLLSYSQRDMVERRPAASQAAVKHIQNFFLLDAQTRQPICLQHASSAVALPQATAEVLRVAREILLPGTERPLCLADVEHYGTEMLDLFRRDGHFDLLVPARYRVSQRAYFQSIPNEEFTTHWAGFATAVQTFHPPGSALAEPCYRFIQRTGGRAQDYHYKTFVCTARRPEVPALTQDFPSRWHIEEFFRFDQSLGWDRAGTLNLNIRLGQMSLALVAQTVIHQLRQRLGSPYQQWDSPHLARDFFTGLDGDLRVQGDTLLVTYYNAAGAERWKHHFENLPALLSRENVDPRIPWLYNFKLDFRFK